jgi:hypothetical protein
VAHIEYRPVLVCQPDARCLRSLRSADPDVVHEHVVRKPGVEFTSEDAAREHANGMRTHVYGTDHDVRIDTRVVSDWLQPESGSDQYTIPLDEDSDVVDVYTVNANLVRLQISNADGDYFAAHLGPREIVSLVEALAAHV